VCPVVSEFLFIFVIVYTQMQKYRLFWLIFPKKGIEQNISINFFH